MVPICKAAIAGKPVQLQVCCNYHHHPMPLPEDLMQKLGGGYGFTMIDLADAYAGSRKS